MSAIPGNTDDQSLLQQLAFLKELLPILAAHQVKSYEPATGAVHFFAAAAVAADDSVPQFPDVKRAECTCGCPLAGHSDNGPCYNCVNCHGYEERKA